MEGIGTSGAQAGSVWISVLILLACIAALFPGAVFRGQAILPGNLIFAYHPWQTEFPEESAAGFNWILFDEILEFVPWRETIRSSVGSGKIPLWDPTAFCGYPFAGLYQNALLYIPDRLMDALPLGIFTLLRAVFHILAAGIGMNLYLRRTGLGRGAVIFGSVAYALSGFMMVWLGHPHSKTAAWMPFLFIGADLIRKRSGHAFAAATLAIALTLTAGHIETALHTLAAAVLYLVLSVISDRPRTAGAPRSLVPAAAAVITALLISGAMALPFSEYLVRSVAFATRQHGVVTQGWLDPVLAMTMLMPKLFGSSADFNYWYPGFNSCETGGAFFGATTLLLACAAIWPFRKQPFVIKHTVLAGISALTAFGVPPVYGLIHRLPGFKVSYNFRLVLILAFSAICLAAYMLDQLTKQSSARLRFAVIGPAIVMIASCFAAEVYVRNGRFGEPGTRPFLAAAATATVLLATLLIVASGKTRLHPPGQAAIVGLMAAELLMFGRGFNPESAPVFPTRWPGSTTILRNSAGNAPFRALPIGKTYPPHIGSLMNMHDIRGNDAMTPLIIEDYLACIEPELRDASSLPALRSMWLNTWDSPLLNALNIRYFAFPTAETAEIPDNLTPVKTAGGVHIFGNPSCLDRAYLVYDWGSVDSEEESIAKLKSGDFDPARTAFVFGGDLPEPGGPADGPGSISIRRYDAHRVDIDATTSGPGLLVLSDTYFPGWTVTVNGENRICRRVNHMMRGVFLDSGIHAIRFSYQPISWRVGLFLTMLGCACFAGGWFVSTRAELIVGAEDRS